MRSTGDTRAAPAGYVRYRAGTADIRGRPRRPVARRGVRAERAVLRLVALGCRCR
ncbi:hypothetical protein ACIBEA_03135 [Streptomyces sp. NPDC051555]|uniref:hypothetical protein n=1 Tax=Streptomyces sp. NPDC051555 TaxID=3365657 RepID=UPI0037A843A6